MTRRPRPHPLRAVLLALGLAGIVTAPVLAAGGSATSGGGAESTFTSGPVPAWAAASGLPAILDPAAALAVASASAELPPSADAPVPAVPGVVRATTSGSAIAYRHGSRARKVVALTFDDGYSPSRALAIFRILQAEHVPATFFPYARAMLEAPAVWRQIAAAGDPIGNHTYRHVNLTHLSTTSAVKELALARSTIARVTGRTQPAIMRPPYGAYSAATLRAAALAGYPAVVLWDVDTRDWSGISSSSIVSRAIVGTRGSIVLMHAGPANTPSAVRAIIASYRSRGYTFVTVPQLLGIAWP